MNPERKEIVRRWYRKAANDLAYAELGLNSGETFYAGAAYHCQQAAEKSIKALLCLSGVTPPKNHDLVRLIELLLPSQDLSEFMQDAEFLTPMATEFRYPGEQEQPTKSDAEKPLKFARQIFSAAERLIIEKLGIQ